jgi:hypothetical protein
MVIDQGKAKRKMELMKENGIRQIAEESSDSSSFSEISSQVGVGDCQHHHELIHDIGSVLKQKVK